jgi:exonuclease SbcC
MLAFEDYSNAVGKVAKVREVLHAVIRNASVEIRGLAEQIADEQKELRRLGQGSQGQANTPALEADFASLRARILKAGFAATSDTVDAGVLRGWRAAIEGRHAESYSRSNRLATLAKEVSDLARMNAERTALALQLAQREEAAAATEAKRSAAEMAVQRAERTLAEVTVIRAQAQNRAALLEWIRSTKPRYATLLGQHESVSEALEHASRALAEHRASEEHAVRVLRTRETRAAQANERLTIAREELVAVQHLIDATAAWQANRVRSASFVEQEHALLRSLEPLRAEERDLSQQIAAILTVEARLSRQISEVDQNQSQLNQLLSQLQGHIRDGTCPLCGQDHGSTDGLIHRIQTRIAVDAATSVRVELTGVQQKAAVLRERAIANKEKQRAAEMHLATLTAERAQFTAEIAAFSGAAKAIGFDPAAAGPKAAEHLQERRARVEQEIEELSADLETQEAALQAARTAVAQARTAVAASTTDVADRTQSLARLQEDADRLRNARRLTDVPLDVDEEQLGHLERDTLQEVAKLSAEAAKAEADVASQRPQLSALAQESLLIRAELATVNTHLARLRAAVTQTTARLSEFQLAPDTSEAAILAMVAEEARAQARLLALRDSVSSLELALDAATTAAALSRVSQGVRSKERALAAATHKRAQHEPWLEYFEELSHLVSSRQDEAIASFTREYGPRTSVIQQRLRSVYGFDEIEIQSHASTISVRVRRRGEELRPTDYFSQSQQQTLLLGLFLTACVSQTWSALCPVFLDDPVTHFDDLNTYAFLDLLVGLIESEPGRRQFVISTCDERLLQLAQRKFRHLKERARFYRFSAIGATGPVVDEIPHPQSLERTPNTPS